MRRTKPTKLGRVQMQIMRVLWNKGEVTARDITEDLSRKRRIAHSTVQTLLRQLEAKGTVTHRVEDRTFIFRPLVTEQDVTRDATRDLVDAVFGGSISGLVAHLVKREDMPAAEMERIRKLVEETGED